MPSGMTPESTGLSVINRNIGKIEDSLQLVNPVEDWELRDIMTIKRDPQEGPTIKEEIKSH